MKKHMRFPTLILLTLMAFTACQQQEEEGLLKLGLELSENKLEKSAITEQSEITGAILTITDMNGIPVMEKEHLELIRFGSSYVTQSLTLGVGEYILVEFMLMDAAGQATWATPVTGSSLASLVRNPLPRSFAIHPESTTSLDLQVVPIGDHTPADFGYAEFIVDFVESFCLKVYYKGPDPYFGNDTTPCFEPMPCFDTIPCYEPMPCYDTLPYYDPAGVPWYEPRITFMTENRIIERPMHAGLNLYTLPVRDGEYIITAFNCYGQIIYEEFLPMAELGNYGCEPGSPALVIGEGSDPDIVITEEGIREPSIDQGVFGRFFHQGDSLSFPTIDANGDSAYFPAPAVYELHVFPETLMESLMQMSMTNCYISPDWIAGNPLAVVRSNSEGYFQLPLEVGPYSYMVLTEQGYYVDMYISSRIGGHLEVYPGEVTELFISIIDCSMWMGVD